MKETNKKIIEEVVDEINSALNDPKGLVSHQRRIAFSISIGSIALFEEYLDKKNILRPGTKINHQWMKKNKENVKKIISKYLTIPIENLSDVDTVLDILHKIEFERNELAYGKPVSEEKLNKKINLFLDLKKRFGE